MHTSATKSMFLMSRNVLTSPSVENKTCKDNACRDRLADLCRKTLCAGSQDFWDLSVQGLGVSSTQSPDEGDDDEGSRVQGVMAFEAVAVCRPNALDIH